MNGDHLTLRDPVEFAQTRPVSIASPSVEIEHAPSAPASSPSGTTLVLINFGTAARTIRCLASIARCDPAPDRVLVLDNASEARDFATLASEIAPLPASALRLYRSPVNLGFAAGSNFLVHAALDDPACRQVALLNNDAVAETHFLSSLSRALGPDPAATGLAGGRMDRLGEPGCPDTLGISLYASLMPANRLDAADPYLGPTGGCCLLSRGLVERLVAVSGYCFDPRFFCYCEDTDLALRAVMLGFRPAWAPETVALHEGQASSGADSEFIAYHGLRNLVWMHAKLVPGRTFAKYGLLLAAAHAMTVVRQGLMGRIGLMGRVYRDAFARLPEFRAERARFARETVATAADLDRLIAPRFYRRGYFAEVLASIRRRWRRSPGTNRGRAR